MKMVRQTSALALIVTLSVTGIPLPAHAGESPPLTFNGRPLSQLLNRAATGDPFRLAGLLEQETGQISGVALDGEGQPLADHSVQLTKIVMVGGNRGEQLSRTATTDAEGRFSFTGLGASEYLLEVMSGDAVLANAPVTLTEDAMQVIDVRVAAPADPTGNWWQRQSIGAKAGIIGVIGVGALIGLMYADCADGQGS